SSELRLYLDQHGLKTVPLIGNVYLLSSRVAQIFSEGRIPGIVVTPPLLELCRRHGESADGGKAFFQEFAAKQIAIYRGLGFRGVYLGGVHHLPAIEKILEIERTFAADDWKSFAREIRFSRPGEFFYYGENPTTGLANTAAPHVRAEAETKHVGAVYRLSKWSHGVMFTPGRALANWGANACRNAADPKQGPKPLRAL